MTWGIAHKDDPTRLLGAVGTTWVWMERGPRTFLAEDKQSAADFMTLLPWRVKKQGVVSELTVTGKAHG